MQRVIIIIIAVMVSLPFVVKSRLSGTKSVPAAFSVTSSARVMVRLSGDVRYAGIYEVSANTLTHSVINMAVTDGDVKSMLHAESASLTVLNGTDINLKVMPDGTSRVTVRSMSAGERMVLGIPLDINSMSKADFERLPGVGPVMAGRIIEYRQKNGGSMRLGDMLSVEGMGDIKYKKICRYF